MSIRPFDQILSVDDLKITADRLGNTFFTPDSMRFFNSRVSDELFWVDDVSGYFVTSERLEDGPRLYTMRHYKVVEVNGRDRLSTDHEGEFQGWGSLKTAKREAKRLQEDAKSEKGV